MPRLLFAWTTLVLTCVPLPAQEPATGGKSAAQWITEFASNKQKTRDAAVDALVGMGPAAVPDLIAALGHPDWRVQYEAANALGRIKDPRATAPLLGKVKAGSSGHASYDAALRALATMGAVAAPELIGALRDPRLSAAAADLLGRVKDPQTAAALVALVGDADAGTRRGAVRALGAMRDPATVPPLLGLVGHSDEAVRVDAARVLGLVGDPAAVGPLVALLRGPSPDAAQAAAWALGRIGGDPALAALDEVSRDASLPGQATAGEALQHWDTRGKAVRNADINALEITLVGTDRRGEWQGGRPPCKGAEPCEFFLVRLRMRALEGFRSLSGLVLGGDLRNARGKPQPLVGAGILDLKRPGDIQAVEFGFVVKTGDEIKKLEVYGVAFEL
jgi:HEAT repeat protein